MTIAIVVGFCVLLVIAAFVAPRLSRKPEQGSQRMLGLGRREAGKAPGEAGSVLQKPFQASQKAVSKSGSAGRRGRGKMPF